MRSAQSVSGRRECSWRRANTNTERAMALGTNLLSSNFHRITSESPTNIATYFKERGYDYV